MRTWIGNWITTLAILLYCIAGVAVAQTLESTTIKAASPEVFEGRTATA